MRWIPILVALTLSGAGLLAQGQQPSAEQQMTQLAAERAQLKAQLGTCLVQSSNFESAQLRGELMTRAAFVRQFEAANKDTGLTLDENFKVTQKKAAPAR